MKDLGFLVIALALVAAPACATAIGDRGGEPGLADSEPGGGGEPGPDEPGGDEPGGEPGGSEPGGGDPVTAACGVPASYADLGAAVNPIALTWIDGDTSSRVVQLPWELNGDAAPDILLLEAWQGYGSFAGGFRAGTFSLTGSESDFTLCGACVLILVDYDLVDGAARVLMADGGTLTIDEFDSTAGSGRVRGSLANVTLREVTFNSNTGSQTEVPGGCTTSLAGFTFDAPVLPPP